MSVLVSDKVSTPDTLLAAHREAMASGAVARLVTNTLADHNQLALMAARSYEHANGFDKLVLEVGSGWKMRFHYWPTPEASLDGVNIHNHRWDFASSILLGTLQAHYYEVTEDVGGALDAFSYESPDGSNAYRFTLRGRAGATLVETTQLPVGITYALDHQRSHRVSVIDSPAASLVLQGPVRKNATRVLRKPNSPEVDTAISAMTLEKAFELLTLLNNILPETK